MENLPHEAERNPIVRIEDGEAMADSRDVAAHFGKKHLHVLEKLRNMECSDHFRRSNFRFIKIKDLTGESTSHALMTKDGFAFVVLGYTGAKAAKFKEAYIAQFNAMEAELRRGFDPATVLEDPAQMRGLLLSYTEKVLELQGQVAQMEPKTRFYDAFINGDGLYGLQNAGRALNCRPQMFVRLLKTKWLFYQGGNLIPYVEYTQMGIFETKSVTVGDSTKLQTFITPHGLSYFAGRVPDNIKIKKAG